MAKKRRKTLKRGEKKPGEKPINISPPENDKPHDFGGLPALDFKKNMGCG